MIALTLMISGISFLALLFSKFDFCHWVTISTLYHNKSDKSKTVVTRVYDCGVFDTNTRTETMMKTTYVYGLFEGYTEINVLQLDTEEWNVE